MTQQDDKYRIRVSDHIYLSPPEAADKTAFVEYLNDKEIHDRTLRLPFPYTEADAESFLDFVASNTAQNGFPQHFSIREKSGKTIGGCGFSDMIVGHRGELGYWLAKPFWGQGIMTEVVGVVCGFAFEEWKLVRITAHVFSDNVASARVLEKNGFLCEGILHKHHKKNDQFLDSKLYALVR